MSATAFEEEVEERWSAGGVVVEEGYKEKLDCGFDGFGRGFWTRR